MKYALHITLLTLAGLGLAACGDAGPITETADAAAPVVETQPGIGHIYGRWATDAGLCGTDGARGVIEIGEERLTSANYQCTMTTPEENGEGWLVTLECTGASDVTERVRFVPDDEDLVLNYIDRTEGIDERLDRCP